jgi:hypothetical protein
VVNEALLRQCLDFFDVIGMKETANGLAIETPEVLPMVFGEFLRWLRLGKIKACQLEMALNIYYSPIAPEDVAVGIAEFGYRFGLKDFHNQAIVMLLGLDHRKSWVEKEGPHELAQVIARKHCARFPACRCLIMCWAFANLKTRGQNFGAQAFGFADNKELGDMYFSELYKILKLNYRKNVNNAAKTFEYPPLRDYYMK